jgi:predicted transcriptional regulator
MSAQQGDLAMTPDTRIAPVVGDTTLNIQWSAIIAGAIGAAALAFVLHSFATAIGVSLSSTAPTWRDASFALVFLSGLYLVLTALASYSFGAYIAARLRVPFSGAPADAEFRDGMHGLLVWALATLLTGLIAIAAIQAVPRLTAPSSGASTSVVGENVIAYDLDRLFRSDRRPQGNMDYTRAEAARILLTTTSHSGMQADDRTYLVRLVAAVTGLAPPDAERRVDDVAVRARDNLNRARRSAVILGFMVGAAALIGAVAAWYAACAAGRHRDGHEALSPFWDWGRPMTRLHWR